MCVCVCVCTCVCYLILQIYTRDIVVCIEELMSPLSEKDDPLKSSMHSFLNSGTNQQEIATLDNKVHVYVGSYTVYMYL